MRVNEINRERMTAREIPAEDARYLLDLDFHEDVIGNETGYTVNAHTSGERLFSLLVFTKLLVR